MCLDRTDILRTAAGLKGDQTQKVTIDSGSIKTITNMQTTSTAIERNTSGQTILLAERYTVQNASLLSSVHLDCKNILLAAIWRRKPQYQAVTPRKMEDTVHTRVSPVSRADL